MSSERRSGVIARKLRRMVAVPKRIAARAFETDSETRPPILANSVPKSGTHLLLQVLSALPNVRPWGLFLASQPSFTFRNVSEEILARKIRRMANGELSGAHLYWSEFAARAINERQAVHFFIYRDPRDVVVSEAHYLAEMNRWHRLHGRFARLGDLQARIRLSIEGLDVAGGPDYPDIAERYSRFLPWLECGDVCPIRYESLAGEGRNQAVEAIIRFWSAKAGFEGDQSELIDRALAAIRPEASHTFRSGGSGRWRETMNPATRESFLRHGEALVTRLGYESTKS